VATGAGLEELYDRLPPADLSRDLLAAARGLSVVPMAGAGWSDCGTPERLLACLLDAGRLAWFRRRMARARARSERPGHRREPARAQA
jgi:hypothetical protein